MSEFEKLNFTNIKKDYFSSSAAARPWNAEESQQKQADWAVKLSRFAINQHFLYIGELLWMFCNEKVQKEDPGGKRVREDVWGGKKSERETPPVCIIDLDLGAATCSPPPASKQSPWAATPPPTQPRITSPGPLYTQLSPLGDRWPPSPARYPPPTPLHPAAKRGLKPWPTLQ